MSASSMNYWNVASAVQERLNALASTGNEMYAALESNDDPDEVANYLAGIEARMGDLHGQIKANVPALRKAAKALEDVPGIR